MKNVIKKAGQLLLTCPAYIIFIDFIIHQSKATKHILDSTKAIASYYDWYTFASFAYKQTKNRDNFLKFKS